MKMESIYEQQRRVANALYEAARYRKRYRKQNHLVEFDVCNHRYGVQFLREKYDNGVGYDAVRIYEMSECGRTWVADFNVDTQTFYDMTRMVYSAAIHS